MKKIFTGLFVIVCMVLSAVALHAMYPDSGWGIWGYLSIIALSFLAMAVAISEAKDFKK